MTPRPRCSSPVPSSARSALQVRLLVPSLAPRDRRGLARRRRARLRRAAGSAPRTAPRGLKVPADLLLRIAYTSGTTGQPKGVAYSIERFEARLANHFAAMEYGLGIDDAMLHVGPLTHAAGVHLLPCYLRGARNIVADKFDPEQVLAQIASDRISQLMVVPTMLGRLLEALAANPAADLSALRRVHYGTAPTPTSHGPRGAGAARPDPAPAVRHDRGRAAAVRALSARPPAGRQALGAHHLVRPPDDGRRDHRARRRRQPLAGRRGRRDRDRAPRHRRSGVLAPARPGARSHPRRLVLQRRPRPLRRRRLPLHRRAATRT